MGRKARPQTSATKQVATELRVLRARQDLTIDELARLAGLPKSTMGKVLKGTMTITVEHLVKVSDAFGVDINTIVNAARLNGGLKPERAQCIADAEVVAEAEFQVEQSEDAD